MTGLVQEESVRLLAVNVLHVKSYWNIHLAEKEFYSFLAAMLPMKLAFMSISEMMMRSIVPLVMRHWHWILLEGEACSISVSRKAVLVYVWFTDSFSQIE